MKFSYVKKLINPPLPIHMEGYTRRVATTQHDDIEGQILLFDLDGKQVIWCVLDLILISKSFGNRLRQSISDRFGIPTFRIMISATHTHSGPQTSDLITPMSDVNPAYLDQIEMALIDGVAKAFSESVDVTVAYQEVDFGKEFFTNRNFADAYSNQLGYLLRFKDLLGNVIVDLLNINCHPTILKEDTLSISTDLIGSMRRYYHDKTGKNLVVYLGEAGDVSTRFRRQGTDFDEVERVGKELSEYLLAENWQDMIMDALDMIELPFSIDYDPEADIDLEKNILTITKLVAENSDYIFMLNLMAKLKESNEGRLSYIAHILNLGKLKIVFFPGEIVANLGKAIRNSLQQPILLAAYSNDFNGYAIDKATYGKFGETYFSRFPRGVADQFIAEIVKVLEEL